MKSVDQLTDEELDKLSMAEVAVLKGQLPFDTSDWKLENYKGEAPFIEWVVENILPRGKVALLAAPGDSGKGMLTLDLALKASTPRSADVDLNQDLGWFGNEVLSTGKVVIFSAEDDKGEIHRRLHNMDPSGYRRSCAEDNLYIIPLPNAGGPFPLVTQDNTGIHASEQYFDALRKVKQLGDVVLVNFDPLASFVNADINTDPQVGAFTMGLLASLAVECNCAVLAAHHTRKSKEIITSPELARESIRGTTAIVDGVRTALGLWPVGEKKATATLTALGEDLGRHKVFEGGIVKANGPADREVKTFVRNHYGLLEVRNEELKTAVLSKDDMKDVLEDDIARAARDGHPFTPTGMSSIDKRLEELAPSLRALDLRKIHKTLQHLLDGGRIVKASFRSSISKYLDVPEGPFAQGIGEILPGKRRDK